MRLEITLAGDVAVGRRGGTRQPVPGAARVVLAALVLERATGVEREALAGIVWPEEMPNTWASALRTHVSRARAALAQAGGLSGEVVAATEDGYQLLLPRGVDLVVDVEQADAALDAARRALTGDPATAARLAREAADIAVAPFLRGHGGDWADDVRRRLEDTAVAALLVAAEAAEAGHDGAAAVAAATEAVRRAPLREDAHRALIGALDASGNRAEALRAYQRLRRLLADELGVDPSPETQAAYVSLLGSAPPTWPRRQGPTAGPAAERGPARAPLPFVGRVQEMQALVEAWEQAAEGGRQVVVVSGESGIGKSRLAGEAAGRVAEAGGLVLFGRSDEAAIVPYQPIVEALDGLVAATPTDELPDLGPGAAELAALLPALGRLPDGGATPSARAPAGTSTSGPAEPAAGDRGRLFGAVTDLLAAVADERPVLLVLDDLQWADDDTLLLVRHLLRRAGDAPILVVAITRDHDLEPGHTLGEVVQALDRDGWVRRLELGGLPEGDVAALLGHLRGGGDHREAARRLAAETAGNPLLVTEMARAGAPAAGGDPIPPSVHELVASRVSRLEPPVADLLRAAAVAGTRFDLELAGAAAGLDEDALLDAADAALASGLVVEESADRYRFTHDIVRRTLDAQLSGVRRRVLHRRTADALEHRRAHELDHHAATLAHHAAAGARTGGDLRAVRWSRRAADQAAQRLALTEAVRLRRQALRHVPPEDEGLLAEVTVELGLAELRAEDPGAVDTLARGAELARRHGSGAALADAALALADAAGADGARRRLARALVDTALEPGGPPAAPGGGPATRAGDGMARRARLLVRHLRLGGDLGPRGAGGHVEAMLVALHEALLLHGEPGEADDRVRLAGEIAELADAIGDRRYRLVAAHHQAMVAAEAGDEPALAGALTTLQDGARRGDPFAAAVTAQRRVARLVAEGRIGEAGPALDLAGAAVTAARRSAPDHPGVALLDDPSAIADRHRPVLDWLAGTDPLPSAVPATAPDADRSHRLAVAAMAAVAHGGDAEVAAARAALAVDADRTCGAGYLSYAGAATFHLGRLAARLGETGEAERHLQAALRRHSATRARAWVALTQRALAGVLAIRGRPSDRDWIEALRAEALHVTSALGLRAD